MKKITSLLALVLAFAMLLAACGGGTAGTTAGTQGTSATTESTTTATTGTTASTEPEPEPKTIKILAIGNSFSVDAMEHLFGILKDMGYTGIQLGNLYIGGCSLDTHWDNIQNDAGAYSYYEWTWTYWKETKNHKISTALKAKDWDVITVQQVSQNSGQPETMGNLQNILDYINENKTNKDAKIYWHMTWAYQQNSTHSGFANYGGDQMAMYKAITGAVESTIKTNKDIAGFIPSGTTIQNMRTSYLGDTLTRDGYHMSYGLGRYAAGLTWAKFLTGESIDDVDWVPTKYKDEITPYLDVIKEAVNNAYATPLNVTNSKYPGTGGGNTTPEPELPTVVTDTSITEALTDADKTFLTSQNLDPAKYAVLKMTPVVCAYYNSTSGTGLTKTANNSPQFWATNEKFSTSQLPVGSVITIAEGYQYRPEGWQSLTAKNSASRPANVKTATVKVDASWWTGFSYRGFNVSKTDGSNVAESDTSALRIYVPIA